MSNRSYFEVNLFSIPQLLDTMQVRYDPKKKFWSFGQKSFRGSVAAIQDSLAEAIKGKKCIIPPEFKSLKPRTFEETTSLMGHMFRYELDARNNTGVSTSSSPSSSPKKRKKKCKSAYATEKGDAKSSDVEEGEDALSVDDPDTHNDAANFDSSSSDTGGASSKKRKGEKDDVMIVDGDDTEMQETDADKDAIPSSSSSSSSSMDKRRTPSSRPRSAASPASRPTKTGRGGLQRGHPSRS